MPQPERLGAVRVELVAGFNDLGEAHRLAFLTFQHFLASELPHYLVEFALQRAEADAVQRQHLARG
jgi:hypothetical protein